MMRGSGGGEITNRHHGVATVAEEPAHVAFVHADIEHMALALLTAADVGFFRTAREAHHNVTHEILYSGDRLHKIVG